MPLSNMSEEEEEELKSELCDLMPKKSMVIDMWYWDLHFEDSTFEDCFFEVAFGPEKFAINQAEYLKEDMLQWIDEYGMDYAQDMFNGDEFEELIYDECVKFIKEWRANIMASGIIIKIIDRE